MSKPKPNRAKAGGSRAASGPTGEAASTAPPGPASRRWLIRFAFLVLGPALLVCALELGLRLAGYGHPTTFFKPIRIGDQACLVENDKFGLRFFPAELARSPAPVVMAARKPANTRRIFLLGESAALGDPRPAYGAGRYLQALLTERFPEVRFEVVCLAMTAINSHTVLPIARECARHEGDLWIVYMGNNEMVGPFGACTVFGAQAPPLWRVRLTLALQETRLGQWLAGVGSSLGKQPGPGHAWGGMKMFLENKIAPDDPRKQAAYGNFRRNLDDILAAGHAAGVPILLSTVAVNLKDCPPFASLADPRDREADLQTSQRLAAEGLQAETRGDHAGAAAKYGEAAKLAPQYAEFQFQRGQSLLALGDAISVKEGRACLERARDTDALPFRADSRINEAIRQVSAGARPALELCDAASALAANAPGGVPGKEAFYEHVHFNFDGNYALARTWADPIVRLLKLDPTQSAGRQWASQEVCEQRLGLSEWNRYAVLEDVLQRLSSPPFTEQFQHSRQVASVRAELQETRKRLTPAAAEQARLNFAEAMKRMPRDHRIHENNAQFLEGVGDLKRAAAEWREVRQIIPQHHLAFFQEGRLLGRTGDFPGAAALLGQALALRPDLTEGWLELGKVRATQGDQAGALLAYQRGLALAPEDPRLHYYSGKAQSKLGRSEEARARFRQAAQTRPDYWEARYALGEELAFAGLRAEARKEFEAVIRLKPDYAMAHLNLGVALLQAGNAEEALKQFEETARLDPKNEAAAQYAAKLRARPSGVDKANKP